MNTTIEVQKDTQLVLPKINPLQDIAVDLETCDPDLKTKAPGWVHNNGFICGICISAKEGSFYIPIQHEKGTNYNKSESLKWLQDLLLVEGYDVVFHNAHYDVGWLTQQYGMVIKRNIVDTMLAAPLIDESRYTYSLDSLAKDYIPRSKGKDENLLIAEVKKQFEETKPVPTKYVQIKNKTTGRKSNQEYDNFLKRDDKDDFIILQTQTKDKEVTFRISKSQAKSYLWRLDGKHVEDYGKQDANLTLNLWRIFKPIIKAQDLERVFKLECDLIMPLICLRRKGVRIDLKKAESLRQKYTSIIDKNQKILDDLVGWHVNPNNKKRSLERACYQLNIPFGYTAEGNPSFAEENIPDGHEEFYGPLKQIRKYTKARDVFLTSYLSYCIGDRIHPQFNQLKSDEGGTITGRFSCSNPNLQNIPARDPEIGPEIRSIFLPEVGEKWLALDYSAQEPRMLVHLAIMMGKVFGLNRCPEAKIAMEERFCGRESDFHTEVSKAVIDSQYTPNLRRVPEDEIEKTYNSSIANLPWVHHSIDNFKSEFGGISGLIKFLYKKFRKPAKAVGLGVMYGRGVRSVVEGLRLDGINLTKEEGQEIKNAVVRAVPFLEMVNRFYENMAKVKGYVTTVLGRRGRFNKWEVLDFSDWKDDSIAKEDKKRKIYMFDNKKAAYKFYADKTKDGNDSFTYPQRAEAYKALNKVIQGSSADQAKIAVVVIYQKGKIDKLRLMVHDELGLSITEDDDPLFYSDIMENSLELYCASKCDPSVGENWGAAKD